MPTAIETMRETLLSWRPHYVCNRAKSKECVRADCPVGKPRVHCVGQDAIVCRDIRPYVAGGTRVWDVLVEDAPKGWRDAMASRIGARQADEAAEAFGLCGEKVQA